MIQPIGARVLVKRIPEPKVESSLIEVPETEQALSKFAIVLAVGKLVHGGIEPGNRVILKDYVGAPIETDFDGQLLEASMVMEEDVLAVCDPE